MQHKVLEIIQEAKKIMRHSKRDFMTSMDVELAMKKLNIPTVFGYPSSQTTEFIALDFNKLVSHFVLINFPFVIGLVSES